MTRPLRLVIPDGIYHAYHRGIEKRTIFEDDRDRRYFLGALGRVKRHCDWSVLSYCLMGNHYHLLVHTPVPNLSQGMHRLNSAFAQVFNLRRERTGPVFQGRFGARLVQRDEHLLATLAYVARNPVTGGLCDRPEDWPWSGHRELLGSIRPRVVDVTTTLGLLGEAIESARDTYREAVASAEPPVARGEIVVGDQPFAEWALAAQSAPSPETPLRQRLAARPDLDVLLAAGDEGVRAAHVDYGYTQREIAKALGCHYSTVSRRLRATRKT